MKILQPDLDTLRNYVYEDLSDEEMQAVRQWLMGVTNPEILEAYESLLEERREREALLSECLAHPLRAKMERMWWRMRTKWAENLLSLIPKDEGFREPALQRMSGHQPAESGELVVEAAPGEVFDLVMRLEEEGYVEVFAVEEPDIVHEVYRTNAEEGPDSAEVEVSGVEMESGDERVEVIALIDLETPFPETEQSFDVAELFERLEKVKETSSRSVARVVLSARE